jgi:leucyl aminopeptidase
VCIFLLNYKSKRYIVVGLGSLPKEDDEFKPDGFKIGATIATKCHDEKKATKCAVIIPDSFEETHNTLTDISSAFYSTLYADNRYRTGAKIKPAAPDLESVTLLGSRLDMMMDGAGALESGRKMAKGIFMTKDIVNSPHNVLNSESLADTAQRIAKESNGRLKCTILGKEECEKRGMGAYLGVARGSETDPRFIHITYTPPKSSKGIKKVVGIVGKGLLFDTGGYNIKTQMMELMKFDCGGAAAVLGAARATAELAPEGVEAHFIVAACEVSSRVEWCILFEGYDSHQPCMVCVCRT